jgi:3-phenylpropionate/cinnamic acid dioxygenase small subunit
LLNDNELDAWNSKTGALQQAFPQVVNDLSFLAQPIAADVGGSSTPYVVSGTGTYDLRAIDAAGAEAPGFPKFTGGWVVNSPTFGPFGSLGTQVVAAGTREGQLYVWSTPTAVWPVAARAPRSVEHGRPQRVPRSRGGMPLESAPMSAAPPIEDRIAIEQLVIEYAWLLDHQRWDDVAGLCTEDAVLFIRGREIVGTQGLAEWAQRRAQRANRRTQHQMTLPRLEPISSDEVHGTAALVLHVAKTGGGGTYVDLVGEYEDEYVRTQDGWKFRRRRLVQI